MNSPLITIMKLATKKKIIFFVGLFLCVISSALLIPLYREIAYQDYSDSRSLAFAIIFTAVVGGLTIFISLRKD